MGSIFFLNLSRFFFFFLVSYSFPIVSIPFYPLHHFVYTYNLFCLPITHTGGCFFFLVKAETIFIGR